MKPMLSYLICATPRSGSTLLCAALEDTGIAGRPAEHFELLLETGRPHGPRDYFQGSNDPEVWALLDNPEFESVLGGAGGWYALQPEAVVAPTAPDFEGLRQRAFELGATPNGVFGTKIMWAYFRDFVRLARQGGRHHVEPCEVPAAVFPNLGCFVWIRREDTAEQAVSLWKALQTWRWRQDSEADEHGHELRYSYAAVSHLKLRIDEHNAAWEDFFRSCGVNPVRVVYEDFVKNYETTVVDLVTEIGVAIPAGLVVRAPTMKRQADALSAEWVARFNDEAARTSYASVSP